MVSNETTPDPDEQENWDGLPDDFCEEAIESADYEDEVEADSESMLAAGLDVGPETIDDYHFSRRAITKLWRKGLSRYDAMAVLSQGKFKRSERTPDNTEAYGRCPMGLAKVVFKINEDESISAAFAVVTGHPIVRLPSEFSE